jgi:hypothetical protein
MGAEEKRTSDTVIGLIVGARVLERDLTEVLMLGHRRRGEVVDPVALHLKLNELEGEVRRLTPGWSKP